MQWTPLGAATFLLLNLHDWVPALGFLGAAAVCLGLGGAASALSSFVPGAPRAVVAAGALTAILALAFPPLYAPQEIALIAGYGACLLAANLWASTQPGEGPKPRSAAMSRGRMLADTAWVLGGLGVAGTAAAALPILDAEPSRRLFAYAPEPPPAGFAQAGLTAPVTPISRFYVNSKNLFPPRPGPAGLTVTGSSGERVSLSLTELERLPRVDRYVTLECVDNPVGGPLIGTALWSGVRLAELLARLGMTSSGGVVVASAWDGYQDSVPREIASEALVAYGMNGRTLTADHGYPLRLVLPGLYGFKSVKWLRRLAVAPADVTSLWQEMGWTKGAVIRTTTRIDLARRQGHGVLVAGISFAGVRGINAVQVRGNGSHWIEADVAPPLSANTWRLWKCFIPDPTVTEVEARAIDGGGVPQTRVPHGSYPDGATGYARRAVSG